MPKIECGSIDCKWNDENNMCTYSKNEPLQIDDYHIHTVNEGYKHFHLCKGYEESEEAADIRMKFESDFRYVH